MYCFASFAQHSIWQFHPAVCWQSFNNWLIAGSQHEVSDQSWEVSGSSQLQHNTELIHPYCCRFILMIIVPQSYDI